MTPRHHMHTGTHEKKNRSPAKSSPGGSTVPCNNWSPPTKTDPTQCKRIYSTWVYHTWRGLCREMDSSLSPLDNLSASSDEIELVIVYSILISCYYVNISITVFSKVTFCPSLYNALEERTGRQYVNAFLYLYIVTVRYQRPFLLQSSSVISV